MEIKRQLLRLHIRSWRYGNAACRRELVCRMREQGRSWPEIAGWINRAKSTVQKLWRRGWLERQKKACRSPCCQAPFSQFSLPAFYIFNERGNKEWVCFEGVCAACHKLRWSQIFLLYSLAGPATPSPACQRPG
jgi:hypothetical protein